jgi:hypothetical protein
MIEIPPECVNVHREREFRVAEQKSVVIFSNPEQREIQQIDVDGCVFKPGDGERCDWLLVINGNNMSIYIELKGSDVDKAVQQLSETQARLPDYVRRKRIWIVSYSGKPRHTTTLQVLSRDVRKRYEAQLLLVQSPYRHTI